jgi:microcystin-dependent protein
MALEDLTGTNKGINSLVITNPDGLDPKSEGDNHLRGIKNVLVNCFGLVQALSLAPPKNGAAFKWRTGVDARGQFSQFDDLPIGSIVDFAGDSGYGAGWELCDGHSVTVANWGELFAVIGYKYGGSGANFNVPDLRRRVTVGSGGTGTAVLGNVLSNIGGEEAHQLTVAEMPSHTHGSVNNPIAGSNLSGGGNFNVGQTGATGGDGAHNNMQPSMIMHKIIRAYRVA